MTPANSNASAPAIRVPFRPGDRFIVNGAVVTMGAGSVELEHHETVLHGNDVMLPEDAVTPARRVYFWLMLMHLDPDGRPSYRNRLLDDMNQMLRATTLKDVTHALGLIFKLVQHGEFAKALVACKNLVAFETELLKLAPIEGN